MHEENSKRCAFALGAVLGAVALTSYAAPAAAECPVTHGQLRQALSDVVDGGGNGGLGNDMWATVVTRDGTVCAVARTGDPGEQWPGSRVISAQKANTANAFSLEGFYPNPPR